MALGDAMMMEQFTKSLAGSYREGTLRCILDIAETYPDRPAGVYDIARGPAVHCQRIRVATEAMVRLLRRESLGPFVLWILAERLNLVKIFLSLMCSSCRKRRTSRRHPCHLLESRLRLTRKVSQSVPQVHHLHRLL